MARFAELGIYIAAGLRPQGEARPVLWPVKVHRVLYPESRRAQLNVFQRAVLGLIRARVAHQVHLAELTGLHPNLITLILAQCISNGWLLHSADILTPLGQRLLDDEDDGIGKQKSGYLFQDMVSGKFWPRLVSTLQQIEPINPLDPYPQFILNKKTGAVLRPHMISASRSSLPLLERRELMLAWRDYRDDYRASQQLGGSSLSPQINLHGLQVLEEDALCARMLLWITSDKEGGELWAVADPFDLRSSAWWLDLPPIVENDARLLRILRPLVAQPCGEEQSYQQWLETVNQHTDLQILMRYPWVERQPDVKRYLAALLVRGEKLEQGDNSESELSAALNECQKLLEVVMQWLIRRHPANAELLPKQSLRYHETKKFLQALAIPAFTPNVTDVLAGQKIDQIRYVCNNPAGSLKALLFAAALGAHQHSQHPFWILDAEELNLPILLELAERRNKSSHGRSKYIDKPAQKLTPQIARESISYALSFTERFKDWM